jgi:hypothetical protein
MVDVLFNATELLKQWNDRKKSDSIDIRRILACKKTKRLR